MNFDNSQNAIDAAHILYPIYERIVENATGDLFSITSYTLIHKPHTTRKWGVAAGISPMGKPEIDLLVDTVEIRDFFDLASGGEWPGYKDGAFVRVPDLGEGFNNIAKKHWLQAQCAESQGNPGAVDVLIEAARYFDNKARQYGYDPEAGG